MFVDGLSREDKQHRHSRYLAWAQKWYTLHRLVPTIAQPPATGVLSHAQREAKECDDGRLLVYPSPLELAEVMPRGCTVNCEAPQFRQWRIGGPFSPPG